MPRSTSSTEEVERPPDGTRVDGGVADRADFGSLLEVGRIIRPHGIRGGVVVQLVTNRLERLRPGARLVCSQPKLDRPSPPDELEVVASRPHQGRHIVVFAGVSSIDAAEPLRDVLLSAAPLDDPDALFVHDLIGRTVVDAGGVPRGTVTAVEANPASDLLVLDERHYVPLRFVVRRDADGIVVDVPDGLFD